jgi:hypothetical protein
LKILRVDRECYARSIAPVLKGRCGSDCRVKRDIRIGFLGWAGRDVPATPASRPGLCPASALLARQAIDRILKPPRNERISDLDLIPALPPASLERIDDGLLDRLCLTEFFSLGF